MTERVLRWSEQEGIVMARILSLQEVELRPGADPAEFERVFAAEVAPSPTLPGFRARLLKGDRGVRAGKFLLLLEMEDEQTRDRYFPAHEETSEEFRRFWEQHPDTAAAWDKIHSLSVLPNVYSDYVVVVE
jgi:hypothetical protein